MRIHFFILSLKETGGGSHQNAITQVRALRALGHEVSVHTFFSRQNQPPSDISVIDEHADSTSFLDLQHVVAEALAREETEADTFLVYGQALVWGAGMYRQRGSTPVAVYLDSHLDSMKEAYRPDGFMHRLKHRVWELAYGLRIIRHVDALIATSPYLAERYVQHGFPEERMIVVPNAFDLPPATDRDMESAHRWSILYVGRFSHEKGTDILLDALSLLEGDTWHARIVGDGPERALLEEKNLQKSLTDRVDIVPWLPASDLAREYARADALVLPSRVPEPFGRVLVEAMHAGVPVVVPRKGGAAWVAGAAGVTFESESAVSLAAAIRRLLDESERDILGKKALARARSFAASNVGVELLRVLDSARDSSAASPSSRDGGKELFLRITRFGIAGAGAVAVNLVTLYFLVYAGLWYLASSLVAFLIGFVASFTLQKFWTFGDRRTHLIKQQIIPYFAIVLINLGINTILVFAFVEYGKWPPLAAQAVAALLIACESFWAYRLFVFR